MFALWSQMPFKPSNLQCLCVLQVCVGYLQIRATPSLWVQSMGCSTPFTLRVNVMQSYAMSSLETFWFPPGMHVGCPGRSRVFCRDVWKRRAIAIPWMGLIREGVAEWVALVQTLCSPWLGNQKQLRASSITCTLAPGVTSGRKNRAVGKCRAVCETPDIVCCLRQVTVFSRESCKKRVAKTYKQTKTCIKLLKSLGFESALLQYPSKYC